MQTKIRNLVLLCLALAAVGCSSSPSGPEPIKEGDYASEPGKAGETK
jgi:hypothetical protein